ncbi:MAG: FAD-binding oxidoreductase [Trueperaceae bacterium]|nr:FAD-binding oxidoreductase [Trueperaceae bacterium]
MADKTLDRSSPDNDVRWDHRWGYTDTRFIVHDDRSIELTGSRYNLAGYRMYDFIPFLESQLGISFDPNNRVDERPDKPVPAPVRNEPFIAALQSAFSERHYSLDDRERLIRSHGQTTADEIYKVMYGELERVADLIFFPESEADVETLVSLASEHNVCVVPYGGGTSVSCALKLPRFEERMIVVADTRRMNKILWIDEENRQVCAEAGITGKDLEDALHARGYTTGHEPDSIELSTLGGWIATNSSGMKKNRYGNIEEIVENVSMVTPRGVVEQAMAAPRVAMGMQPQRLLFGSEGNLGLITKAVLRLHKLPEVKRYGSVVFPDFPTGVAFLRELADRGVLPASVRLVDNLQFRFGQALKPKSTGLKAFESKIQKFFLTRVRGFDPKKMAATTLVMEGGEDEVALQEKLVYGLAKKHGGIRGGSSNGQRGYMLTYAIAYIRDFMAEYHVLGETYETTVPWDKVVEVCDAVQHEARVQHDKFGLPGKPFVSPRVTQLYRTGVCIYFTHGVCVRGIDDGAEVFGQIERAIREKIMSLGGSISHHHGVGKLRKPFLPDTLSPSSIALIRGLKHASDPQNVFGINNNVIGDD